MRDQVFFVPFLLRDIQFLILVKLVSADWFLFQILLAKLLKKVLQILINYSERTGKRYERAVSKKYLAQWLDIPKNSCCNNPRETSMV